MSKNNFKLNQFRNRTLIHNILYQNTIAKSELSTFAKNSFDISKSLPDCAYKQKAQELLSGVLKLNKGLPEELNQFLLDKIKDFTKLKETGKVTIKLIMGLNSQCIYFFADEFIEYDPKSKFIYEFAKKTEELFDFRLSLILNSYVGELEEFEKVYISDLKRISAHEHSKLVDQLLLQDKHIIVKLLAQESAKLAQCMLDFLG